jgi:nucleotide-binding universal stress UspA family protein
MEVFMMTIRGILVATDFSEPAAAAFAWGEALTRRFGSHLHILHVVPIPQIGWTAESSFSWPFDDVEAEARNRLSQLVPSSDPLAARTSFATTVGVPVTEILDYVKNHEIDLIVLGTHGRGLVGQMLLGSVAERVVRLASVPVLTVHRNAAGTQSGNVNAADRGREKIAS